MSYLKVLQSLLLIVFITNLQSCSRHLVPSQSISGFSYSEYEMSYNVVTSGNNRADAMKNASKKVFENIFYVGTPGSINNLPMLDGNKDETKVFFSQFISNEDYKQFVTSVLENSYSNTDNVTRRVKLETKIIVNIESLRRYLQKSGVIRKFGY